MDELVKKADVIECLRIGRDESIEISRRGIKKYILGVCRKIKQLPTIQPERGQLIQEEESKMDDLIRRQDAVDFIKNIMPTKEGFLDPRDVFDELGHVPSAEKKGKWNWDFADNGWADWTCSICGWKKNTDIHVNLGYNFCPNCGADMRGGQNDND